MSIFTPARNIARLFVPTGIDVTVEPATLELAATLHTPNVVVDYTVTPTTLELAVTLHAPTVVIPSDVTVSPDTLELALTQHALAILFPLQTILPDTFELALTQETPVIVAGVIITPDTFELALTQDAPTVHIDCTVIPDTFELAATLETPVIGKGLYEHYNINDDNFTATYGALWKAQTFEGGLNLKIDNALVTFVLDDCHVTAYTIMKPVFDAQEEVACLAVPSNAVGAENCLSLAQLLEMEGDGWEVLSHSKTHAPLLELSEEELEVELLGSKNALEGMGFTINNFVYPYHEHSGVVRKMTREYYESARGGAQGISCQILETYALRSLIADTPADLPTYKAYVDKAESSQAWMIFYLHIVDAADATAISELIDYIQAKNINIVTVKQALDSATDLGETSEDQVLDFIKVQGTKVGSPGTITFSIRETDGNGRPAGNDISTGTYDGNSFPAYPTRGWSAEISMTPCVLLKDTKYAIVPRVPSGNTSNYFGWGHDRTNPTYAGGQLWASIDSGETWSSNAAIDQMFEIWSIQLVRVEPATLELVLAQLSPEVTIRFAEIPPFMQKDLIDPYSGGAWLWLCEIAVPGYDMQDLARNTADVRHAGKDYNKWNLDIGRQTFAGDGSIPRVVLRVGQDPDHVIEDIVNASEGCHDGTVKLIRVNEKFLDYEVEALEVNYGVLVADSDTEWIYFTLGIPNPLTQRIPLRIGSSKICPWMIPEHFKGVRCQYIGDDPTCKGTIDDCYTKGNAHHWGAEIGLDPNVTRV